MQTIGSRTVINFIVCIIVFFGGANLSHAKTKMLQDGDRQLAVSVPEGVCFFDPTHALDKDVLQALSASVQLSGQVISAMIDCDTLQHIRKEGRLMPPLPDPSDVYVLGRAVFSNKVQNSTFETLDRQGLLAIATDVYNMLHDELPEVFFEVEQDANASYMKIAMPMTGDFETAGLAASFFVKKRFYSIQVIQFTKLTKDVAKRKQVFESLKKNMRTVIEMTLRSNGVNVM